MSTTNGLEFNDVTGTSEWRWRTNTGTQRMKLDASGTITLAHGDAPTTGGLRFTQVGSAGEAISWMHTNDSTMITLGRQSDDVIRLTNANLAIGAGGMLLTEETTPGTVIRMKNATYISGDAGGSARRLIGMNAVSRVAIDPDVMGVQIFGGIEMMAAGSQASPTGGNKGGGTINVAGNIYKNDSLYSNPDYAFEHYFTGSIVKFAGNEGASDYPGLWSLADVKAYAQQNYELPRVADKKGIFDRTDILLEKMEEVYLYLFGHEDRLAALENEEITVDSDGELADGNGRIKAETVEAREGIFETITSTIEAVFDHVKAQTLDVAGKLTAKTAQIASAVIDNLTVKRARANELEMVDRATGEIYCTWVENGDWQKSLGPCP